MLARAVATSKSPALVLDAGRHVYGHTRRQWSSGTSIQLHFAASARHEEHFIKSRVMLMLRKRTSLSEVDDGQVDHVRHKAAGFDHHLLEDLGGDAAFVGVVDWHLVRWMM